MGISLSMMTDIKRVLEFQGQIREVKSKITASNDLEYRINILTDDPKILALGTLGAETLVNVKIDIAQ